MTSDLRPFLMFEGQAEEAMRFYAETFAGAEIVTLEHHEDGDPESGVLTGLVRVAGKDVACFDSPVKHQFGFTPALSLFVDCEAPDEVDRLAATLAAAGGGVLMPAGEYPFATRFAWVNDRFGVSWQLRAT